MGVAWEITLDPEETDDRGGEARPHLGYRNEGRRPIETINEYLESVREAA